MPEPSINNEKLDAKLEDIGDGLIIAKVKGE